MKFVFALIFLFITSLCFAQNINPNLFNQQWKAEWIKHPSAQLKQYEVYHFRRTFSLPNKPDSFIIHVSADSRYKLFVNGNFIGLGPARSDLPHWNFETYNIASYLQAGTNAIAALVWNEGEWNGLSQHSYQTAFLLQGNDSSSSIINTNQQWKVMKDEAYSPIIFQRNDPRLFWQYYVAGALDSVQMNLYPWQWQTLNYNDSNWQTAAVIGVATPVGVEGQTRWNVEPRPVALLENTHHRFEAVRKTEGVSIPNGFPQSSPQIIIPANTHASILLDTKYEVTGYPQLLVSGGKNSHVTIGYAETLFDIDKNNRYKWHKTNRDEVEGKQFVGVYDAFVPDGGSGRSFEPLWMRVFRYVKIDVKTNDEPLIIDDVSYRFTLYPFVNEASFVSNDSIHQKIFDACLRTIRLASNETYLDPYYEQMQYIGDTRIEALYAYYHFKDDRLTKNAIQQFAWSMSPEGITMSRYPSDLPQYTSLYALCWMLMVNDYWQLRNDDEFVKQFVPGMLNVLQWFEQKVNKDGMLGGLPYLDFLDTFYPRDAILNASKSKSLTPYNLFYVYTVQQLQTLFEHFGKNYESKHYTMLADKMKATVIKTCYNKTKGLFADNPEQTFYSQHSNIMAVLTNCVSPAEAKKIMQKQTRDTSLIPVSLYFKFYEFAALKKADMGDEILNQLNDWKAMLNNHMHTFSEWLVDPRSECHSWSAYPAYYFLNTIAGIEPNDVHFQTIKVEPNVGKLTHIKAQMPHPNGFIKAEYQKQNDGVWNINVQLPKSTNGVFVWKNKTYPLHENNNAFTVK